jgi:hypothetical protein
LPLFSFFSYMVTPFIVVFFPLILIFEIIAYSITVLKWDELGGIIFLSINGVLLIGYLFFLFIFVFFINSIIFNLRFILDLIFAFFLKWFKATVMNIYRLVHFFNIRELSECDE